MKLKQTLVSSFLLMAVGGALIGYNGGGWGVLGLALVSIGHILMQFRDRGYNADFSDMFEEESVGRMQAKLFADNYPPGFNKNTLD